MAEPIYIVFDGMPGANGCHFTEVENEVGSSVSIVGLDDNGVSWKDHPHSKGFTRLGPFVPASEIQRFQDEIERLTGRNLEHALRLAINRFSAENGSDTADVVLAEYLMACLKAFDAGVRRRGSAPSRDRAEEFQPTPDEERMVERATQINALNAALDDMERDARSLLQFADDKVMSRSLGLVERVGAKVAARQALVNVAVVRLRI